MVPPLLVTNPPSEIVNMPMPPKSPTMRPPLASQTEPAPVTVTVPCAPLRRPMVLSPLLLTWPPFSMMSVPLPSAPTTKTVLDQEEPTPVTVTVPCDPASVPTTLTVLVSVAPSRIVSWPVP
jgi:hypothetical protein